jgi:hypothetical protein
MIMLDPEFVGGLAPPSKLTTAIDGKPDLPFARLPRLERLRVSGKADETEVADADVDAGEDEDATGEGAQNSRAEKEKKKMRGKNKSLKRLASLFSRLRQVCSHASSQLSPKATQERHRPKGGENPIPRTCNAYIAHCIAGRFAREVDKRPRGAAPSQGDRKRRGGAAEAFSAGPFQKENLRPGARGAGGARRNGGRRVHAVKRVSASRLCRCVRQRLAGPRARWVRGMNEIQSWVPLYLLRCGDEREAGRASRAEPSLPSWKPG